MCDEKSNVWVGISDTQMKNRVRNVRSEINRKDICRLAEMEQVGNVRGCNNWFLQLNTTVRDPETNEIDCIVGFRNPELFYLMNKGCHTHFDGTFYCVPKGFKQCFVIMVCDEDSQCHTPCLCALMTGEFKFYDTLHE